MRILISSFLLISFVSSFALECNTLGEFENSTFLHDKLAQTISASNSPAVIELNDCPANRHNDEEDQHCFIHCLGLCHIFVSSEDQSLKNLEMGPQNLLWNYRFNLSQQFYEPALRPPIFS